MDKKITILYWHGQQLPEISYKHQEEFPYTSYQLMGMIEYILFNKYSVMIRPQDNGDILVWIDNGRFGQK